MPITLRLFLLGVLLIVSANCSFAQADSSAFNPKWGIDLSYTGMSYTESAVIEFQITYTVKKHAIAFGPHVAYHDLFEGQSDWARFGVDLTYSFFPFRSNRLFSPYLFYDLNYAYIKAKRQVILTAEDGVSTYTAIREVQSNSIAHHFGIGTRVNFYKGFFLHLSLGAGPSTFGDNISHRSLQSAYPDTKETQHPFSHFDPAYMFRIGIAYQVDASELKKISRCCD